MMKMKKLYAALICTIASGGVMAQFSLGSRALHGQFIATDAHHASPPTSRGVAIWSDDFSTPSNWTMGTSGGAIGNWVIGTAGPVGSMSSIASTTAANGFALYDSNGLALSGDNAYIQNATPIDLTGHPSVSVEFEQYYASWLGQTFFEVSNDNVNWTTTELNSSVYTLDATLNPALTSVIITPVAGNQATVWIRFRYTSAEGHDFAWMVDDVAIVDQPGNDLSILSASTAAFDMETSFTTDSVRYPIYPISEIRPVPLNMIYLNRGAEPATNITAHITSTDGYDETIDLGTLASGDTATFFAPSYTPTSTLGVKTLNFSITADGTDADPSDNEAITSIRISDATYARDEDSMTYRLTSNGAYSASNVFYINVDETLHSIGVALHNNTSSVGQEIQGQLWNINSELIQETDLHTIAAGDLNDFGGNNFVNLVFPTPIPLDAGTHWIVTVRSFSSDVQIGTSGRSPLAISFLNVDPDAAIPYWGWIGVVPMIRMNFEGSVGIAEQDINNGIGLGQSIPNPATDNARIDFSLEAGANVNMDLFNISGKLVRNLAKGHMAPGVHQVNVNTSDLEAGVYFYTLTTGKATSTKRMTVVR